MAEQDAPERPADEAHRIGGKRGQRAGQRVEPGKEDLVEHQRRGGAVQKKSNHSMLVPIMLDQPAST